jgi:hypothetical protein
LDAKVVFVAGTMGASNSDLPGNMLASKLRDRGVLLHHPSTCVMRAEDHRGP